jgi:hypothetical protein
LLYLRVLFAEAIELRLGRLCGLVIIVSGYRSRGHCFDSRRYKIFREVVGIPGSLAAGILAVIREKIKPGTLMKSY